MKAIVISNLGIHKDKNNKEYQKLLVQLENKQQVTVCNYKMTVNINTELELEKKDSFYNIKEILENKPKYEFQNAEKYVNEMQLAMCFKLAVNNLSTTEPKMISDYTKELYQTYEQIKKELES